MYFGKKNPCHIYYLNGTPEEKDLGISFDPTLKFRIHINNIISKAKQVLIKHNFIYTDNETLVKLYKSLVRPHLGYGQSV